MRVIPFLRPLAVLLLVGSIAAAASTAGAATTPRNPDAVALRWGDTYFSDPSQLAAWLNARGASYDVWAERHPGAAELLEWAAAERARRAVPQGAPFRGVPERTPGAVAEAEPVAIAAQPRGVPLWIASAIALGLLAGGLAANAAARRTGRPGVEPITLAVSGAGLAAGVFLVVFVANTRF